MSGPSSPSGAAGRVAMVLHAHLPYVRHPDGGALEERWLFEALTESYLPLLDVLGGLEADAVPARLTVSVSPTLLAMLGDPLLRTRYGRHLDALLALADSELRRTRAEPAWEACARLYRERLGHTRDRFLTHWRQDVVGALRGFEEHGCLELATTAATHAVLPLLSPAPAYARAQIALGVAEHRRHFGRPARGFWLPECAFAPGLDDELARAGVRWTVLDTHGLLHATPQPVHGVHAPVACPSGVVAYGRDSASATQVWSAEAGYPADPWYRDFHRDIGFDLPRDALGAFASDPHRGATGFKYHRITGPGADKAPYEPARARERVAVHAAHFVAARRAQIAHLGGTMNVTPIVVCPYDAELFGHWWFEGPAWLDTVLRTLAAAPDLTAITLSDDLAARPAMQAATPSASTWGREGHQAVWLSPANDWIYPRLDAAGEQLLALCHTTPPSASRSRRVLAQAIREVLLAQASDWAFMMARGTTGSYATRRTTAHLQACATLCHSVARGAPDMAMCEALERAAPIFPTLTADALD